MMLALSATRGESPTWFLLIIGLLMMIFVVRYVRHGIAWFRSLDEGDPQRGSSQNPTVRDDEQ